MAGPGLLDPTHRDLALQLGLDEVRTIDSPSPVEESKSNPSGMPMPLSVTRTLSWSSSRSSTTST